MVTASNLPFSIQLRNRYRSQTVMEADRFFYREEEAWDYEKSTLCIEENDEIELLFHSSDPNARLYLDALYGIPMSQQMGIDTEGRWYRRPSEDYFFLYKSEDGYEPLCVDVFLLTVFCGNEIYYGTLEVRPKQMDISEWALMKKELEEEVKGLAKNLVRRNHGFGEEGMDKRAIPPEQLSKFLIIKKYLKPVTAALIDIADKPKSELMTTYDMAATGRTAVCDRESLKRYVRTGGTESSRRVPCKTITYDIPGNRMLKSMLLTYEKVLDEFIAWVENANNEFVYAEFLQTAYKARKLSSILKQKPWYRQIIGNPGHSMPHSFIMDARYNTVYRMYDELRRADMSVLVKPQYSYVWKRSSLLYEMWCFVKVCQMLGEQYTLEEGAWERAFSEKRGCQVLKSGTTIRFYNEKVELYVEYDRTLPQKKEQTDAEEPFYMVKMQNGGIDHNKPDITIHMYSKEHGCYIGSLILECKYRKLYSFWRQDSDRSSIGQVQTYYNNARSECLYHGMGKRFNSNPVHQIIILTPDLEGDNVEEEDFNIVIKSMKPSKTEEMIDGLKRLLNENVERALEDCSFLLEK